MGMLLIATLQLTNMARTIDSEVARAAKTLKIYAKGFKQGQEWYDFDVESIIQEVVEQVIKRRVQQIINQK